MLITCPECSLQVSDKAVSCPHCGYPFKANVARKYNSTKRKRLPNGFGQISEMKGHNLRNRFRAMVTVGKNENGKPIVKPLKPQSHFATYNEAYAALVEYNKNPYDLSDSLSMKELYDKWSEYYFTTIKSGAGQRNITAAWNYCSSIYNLRVSEVRARHLKGCIENATAKIKGEVTIASPGTKSRIKSMFNLMFDYALEYELVDRNYARTFNLSNDIIQECENAKRGHIVFTDEEMETLWNNVNIKNYVDVILIQCYSGWRPQELGLIKLEDVDLENWTYVGGIKTEAGTNRLVPIHSKIRPLVKARYDEAVRLGSEYLINCTDGTTHTNSIAFTYDKYQKRFVKIRDELKLNSMHRAHDGRKHFITMAKKYNMDEYAIKYIVGHSISDITERVYTEREISWLKEEMEKIR